MHATDYRMAPLQDVYLKRPRYPQIKGKSIQSAKVEHLMIPSVGRARAQGGGGSPQAAAGRRKGSKCLGSQWAGPVSEGTADTQVHNRR